MKNRAGRLLIFSTLAFLLALMAIQVNWIFKAARMQESHFNHTVNKALDRVALCISSDAKMCRSMSNCFGGDTFCSPWQERLRKQEWKKVDDMLKGELEYYDIHLDYELEITDISELDKSKKITYISDKSYYTKTLEEALQLSGVQLKVKFPKKTEFIIAQIGATFIASILLILFTTASFLIMLRFYLKEKTLSDNIKDFINNLTHEFKTPLANITFANNMIRKNKTLKDTGDVSKYTNIIHDENRKLNNQIEELLDISVLEHNGIDAERENFNMHEVIRDVISGIEPGVDERNGSIRTELDATITELTGKRIHFVSAISNLLDNSVKYSENGPEIEVRTYNRKNHLIIEVSDNGIGISKSDQKLIFDKFYRVPTGDVHNVKGYGMGLSFVKMIVGKYNGCIKVSSKSGKGSVFEVSLPLT